MFIEVFETEWLRSLVIFKMVWLLLGFEHSGLMFYRDYVCLWLSVIRQNIGVNTKRIGTVKLARSDQLFKLEKVYVLNVCTGCWFQRHPTPLVYQNVISGIHKSVKQSRETNVLSRVSRSWYNSGPSCCWGETGRFEVSNTGNQSPSQHLSVLPHAAVKPNHRLTHRRAHSWLTLSLSVTLTHTPFTSWWPLETEELCVSACVCVCCS